MVSYRSLLYKFFIILLCITPILTLQLQLGKLAIGLICRQHLYYKLENTSIFYPVVSPSEISIIDSKLMYLILATYCIEIVGIAQ